MCWVVLLPGSPSTSAAGSFAHAQILMICNVLLVQGCTAPVFTIYKRWNKGPSKDTEVLMPHFGRTFGELFFFPWEQKSGRALLRARLQASTEISVGLVKASVRLLSRKF